MHRLSARLLLLATALTLGCTAGAVDPTSPASLADLMPGSTPVPVTRLASAPYALTFSSGLTTTQRLVIRDAAAWSTVWSAIWSRGTPVPPLPAVDFSREMIVVAALGQTSSGGYDIVIEEAALAGSELVVRVRSTSPAPACVRLAALTQPVDVARLPLHPGTVRFVESATVMECR